MSLIKIRATSRNDFLGACECLTGPDNRRLLQFCRNRATWLLFGDEELAGFRVCGVHHNALQGGSVLRIKRPNRAIARVWKGLVDLSHERTAQP